MFARSVPRPPTSPTTGDARPAPGYVLIPARLVADLADNLAALGLYALIARRFLISQAPVPLSAADARRYDPALSRGASVRALARLAQAGWLTELATPGRKSAYAPTWGVVDGRVRPWAFDMPRLDLPRRHQALRLDRRLLDLYLGRLLPHPVHPAEVARYLTRPLLSLSDVGSYLRALAGHEAYAPALDRLGLVRGAQALDLPDDQTILALASQHTLFDDAGATLSPTGLRRLGITPMLPATHGQPLLFVPPPVIGEGTGSVIGWVIGHPHTATSASAAAGCAETSLTDGAERSVATLASTSDLSDPPPSPISVRAAGGGETRAFHTTTDRSRAAPDQASIPETLSTRRMSRSVASQPQTESARRLRALGARPAVIIELAEAPLALVEAAIAHGQARAGVRDLAAWVIATLRDARVHGWQIPSSSAARAAATMPVSLPENLAALDVEALLARCLSAAPDTSLALPPAEDSCECDGSGSYLLPVAYGHPLWGKPQPCACQHRASVSAALARAAGPDLAASDLARVRVADRPLVSVTWAGRAFTPEEQVATLRHAIARGVASVRGLQRGACLIGPPGSGKTTLAVAFAKELAVRHGRTLRYTSVPQLLGALRREAAEHLPATLLQQLIDSPVLVLDDLGREQLTAFAREQLYRLLDERLRRHTPELPKITYITSNLTFAELYALDAALASRIAAHTEVTLCVASDYRLHAADMLGAAS